METLYNIEGAKLTALEIRILAHVAGDEGGVWEANIDDSDGIREQLDHLVLEGFLERDCDHAGWLNVWRIPEEGWDILGPNVERINHIINNIGEA